MTRVEFEHTVSGMRGRLLGVARRFTKASGLAVDGEDIVQDALTELWQLFECGYPIQNVEALAVKITKTVCVRHYRKRKIQTISIDGADYPGGFMASERVDIQESLRLRNTLWGQLNDTQKKYLEMKGEQEMSLDEIAAATGRPKSSVKATISQARKMMFEQLKKMSR